MITRKQGIVGVAAVFLVLAIQAFAIEGLQIAVQCKDVILTWTNTPGQNYIVEYRPTLDPGTPWITLTSSLPADWSTNVSIFVHSNIVQHPNCVTSGSSSAMSAEGGAWESLSSGFEYTGPMVKRVDGSGIPIPMTIFPPGFEFSNYLILDPSTGEWTSGVGVVRPWPEVSTFATSSGESDGPSPQDAGGDGLDMGFYHVVQDGVKIWDSSVAVLTNGNLSGNVDIHFEAGNAANDGTGTNVLGLLRCAVLLVDGVKFAGSGGVLNSPTNTTWRFNLDTAYLDNGFHYLQIAVTWLNPDNSKGDLVQMTRYSDAVSITVSNEIYYPNWEPEIGEMDISAYFLKTVYTSVGWTIDIFDVSSNLVQTLTNFTTDGVIEAYWNMIDKNGIARTNADTDPEFSALVTVYDEPRTKRPPNKKQRRKDWPDQGKWVIAYQDYFKFEYSFLDKQKGSINAYANTAAQYGGYYIYYPQPGQTNDIGQTYPLRYQKDNHPDTNLNQITTFLDQQMLREFLARTNSRNFYYDGHGTADSYAGIDPILVKAGTGHRYRFVMLNACSSAAGDIDESFGIHGPGTFAIDYYHNTGIRPGAFCGYDSDVDYNDATPRTVNGVPYDDTIPDIVPFFITNFLFYWDTQLGNRTLKEAIRDASDNLSPHGGLNHREEHWKIFGYDDLRIDEVNHGYDTW